MSDSFRTGPRESNSRKGHNVLASAVSSQLDQWLRDIDREEGVSADWIAEYVLGLSGTALSQYRSDDPARNLPYWAVLKLTRRLERLDFLRSTLSAIGVEVSWKDEARPAHETTDLHTLAGLLALQSGKALQAFIEVTSPNSEGGSSLSHTEHALLSPVVHHLRRLADDLDDRLSNAGASTTLLGEAQ